MGKVAPEAGEHDGETLPATASTAVTENETAVPPGFGVETVLSASPLSTGGVRSTTLIVNVPLPVLWCASVALHVTVVAPRWNVDPDEGKQLVVAMGPSMLSFAEG